MVMVVLGYNNNRNVILGYNMASILIDHHSNLTKSFLYITGSSFILFEIFEPHSNFPNLYKDVIIAEMRGWYLI